MRLSTLISLPLVAAAGLALLPGPALATEQIPTCVTTMSSVLCYYAIDPNDCFVANGQRYCRTVGVYEWQQVQ